MGLVVDGALSLCLEPGLHGFKDGRIVLDQSV